MFDELNTAIVEYQQKWDKLISGRKNKAFFESLRMTSVAWKAIDLADFDRRFAELREHADQIHLGWINERWLASLHLRDTMLTGGLTLVKLMQRRPDSTDATGLDHIDFYIDPQQGSAKSVLEQEPDLTWTEEKNGEHCKWISIWFDGVEAKLRSDTVLDVCIEELQDVRSTLLNRSNASPGR